MTIQESDIRSSPPTRCTRAGRRTRRCGRQPWTDITPSSRARRISRPAIGASARRPTNRPPPTAACDASSCRAVDPSRRRDAPTNVKPGFDAGNAGASDARGRISVIKRRHGLRRCRYHGADGMARWVGLGVIADNLRNIAAFVNARLPHNRTRSNESTSHTRTQRIASPTGCDRSFLQRGSS